MKSIADIMASYAGPIASTKVVTPVHPDSFAAYLLSNGWEMASDDDERRTALALAEAERNIRSHRGRWMTVDEYGCAYRYRSKQAARKYARHSTSVGVRCVVRRWRRGLVTWDRDALEYEAMENSW